MTPPPTPPPESSSPSSSTCSSTSHSCSVEEDRCIVGRTGSLRGRSGKVNTSRCCALSPSVLPFAFASLVLAFLAGGDHGVEAFRGASARSFLPMSASKLDDRPKLILIGGPPGTGKSTFGMSVALDQGILKCISTDTVRAVMRSFVDCDVSPALHRSSYEAAYEGDDPVRSWKETCTVLSHSLEGLVDDAISRKVSLVVEGVHVVPSTELIKKWEDCGGVAIGCIIQISDPDTHKKLLLRRGFITGNVDAEEEKIRSFDRVRAIQDEMMKLAREANWLQIEQRTEPDPLEMVSSMLYGVSTETPKHDASKHKAGKKSTIVSSKVQS